MLQRGDLIEHALPDSQHIQKRFGLLLLHMHMLQLRELGQATVALDLLF